MIATLVCNRKGKKTIAKRGDFSFFNFNCTIDGAFTLLVIVLEEDIVNSRVLYLCCIRDRQTETM